MFDKIFVRKITEDGEGHIYCQYHSENVHLFYKEYGNPLVLWTPLRVEGEFDVSTECDTKLWVCFDKDNSLSLSMVGALEYTGYLWICKTRSDARNLCRLYRNNPKYTELSKPYKYYME